MPRSWYSIRQYFLDNSQRPIVERQHIVNRAFFDQLCADYEVLTGSESALLRYLYNSGVIYYDESYLKDIIIADQPWAIDAIYAVLDRQGRLYDELINENYGKKRLKYLFDYFDQAYTYDERRLFVAMMQSCGLCFPLREEGHTEPDDSTYCLFPQFLPNDRPDTVVYFLSDNTEREVYRQTVNFLPYNYVQQLIVNWGAKTDIRNLWRNGLLVELPDQGRFVLEADFFAQTLTLTVERTILFKTINTLLRQLSYPETDWYIISATSSPAITIQIINGPSEQLPETLPDVVQPTIRRLAVSFAKEDVRYVDLLRKKISARKNIDLWYDRHLSGWSDWDTQIRDHFTDCDGYIIFLSDTYMDAETKDYIHEKEIPLMRQRFDAGQAFVAVINITPYNTQHTELAPFLSFKKAAVMPSPDQSPAEASQFLEEFIGEKLYKDFYKGSRSND